MTRKTHSVPSPALVISRLALFLTLTGSALAVIASQIASARRRSSIAAFAASTAPLTNRSSAAAAGPATSAPR
jgi:hypothetical protein